MLALTCRESLADHRDCGFYRYGAPDRYRSLPDRGSIRCASQQASGGCAEVWLKRKLRDGRATLLCEGDRVATVEIAASYRARTRGLLGRDGIDGAILLSPAASVHTLRMRFPIDVAYLTKDMHVLSVVQMKPGRLGMMRVRAWHVLEAQWGAMAAWGIRAGTQLGLQQGAYVSYAEGDGASTE